MPRRRVAASLDVPPEGIPYPGEGARLTHGSPSGVAPDTVCYALTSVP